MFYVNPFRLEKLLKMSLNKHVHWKVGFQSLLYHRTWGATNFLDALLKTHCRTLNDESLRKFIAEAETKTNSKTLIVGTLIDANSVILLSSNNLLITISVITRIFFSFFY